jgi:nitrate reductase gamma subunit
MFMTAVIDVAFIIFMIGIAFRIVRIATMPVHVRWELYPMPGNAVEKTRTMLSEILLLKGVYEHHRALWLWSWLFHSSLYLLIGAAGLSLVASISPYARGGIALLIAIVSAAAFACGTVGTAALIIMRLASPRMRSYASFAALFNVVLLLAIFSTGLAHLILQPSAASVMIAASRSLLLQQPAPPLHAVAAVHLCLMAFFAAYFPFTQMAHAVLKYFTYHSVRWDDRPADSMPDLANRMKQYLAFPVSWSAQHIRDGKTEARWTEVVTARDPKKNS